MLGWYANPFWILGLSMGFVGKPKLAAICGAIAFAIGCTTFSLFGQILPADEGNVNHMTLARTLPGCYVWLASLATLPLVVLFPKTR